MSINGDIKPGERIDQFTAGGIALIQSAHHFTASLDAFLLADFIQLPKRSGRYLDFCTGNGIIPLLLTRKTSQPLMGIDIQTDLIDMAQRSAILNGVQDQVEFLCEDLNQYRRQDDQLFDVISCNPPYFVVSDHYSVHHHTSHAIARHELTLTMAEWVQKAKSLLKTKGRLYIVHRPERLDDLLETLADYQFGVHRMRFVHPKVTSRANGVLIEAIAQGGQRGVKIEPPLIVHDDQGGYSAEVLAIYGRS